MAQCVPVRYLIQPSRPYDTKSRQNNADVGPSTIHTKPPFDTQPAKQRNFSQVITAIVNVSRTILH
jgi:hypothetical protein